MVAESARAFDALERQANQLVELFQAAGYERVAPAIIQPASIFLDRVGEAMRGRTYVFTDAEGQELCLRPDLTIPVARLYMERHPLIDVPARYCYNGPAFRQQPGADQRQPVPAAAQNGARVPYSASSPPMTRCARASSARRASNILARATARRPKSKCWRWFTRRLSGLDCTISLSMSAISACSGRSWRRSTCRSGGGCA